MSRTRPSIVQIPPTQPALNPAKRAKWKELVARRVAEADFRIGLLEQLFSNRTRYRGGVLDSDLEWALGILEARLADCREAFTRGQRKPRLEMPD